MVFAGMALQDPSPDQIRDLIRRLRSENIEERDRAFKKLRDLGDKAVSALEKASESPDAEVAGRTTFLLNLIRLKGKVSDPLRKAIPNVEERLARGQWTAVFVEVYEKSTKNIAQALQRRLGQKDVAFFAEAAIRGARSPRERRTVCQAVRWWRLKNEAHLLIPFLGDEDGMIRQEAVEALGKLEVREAAGPLQRLLDDERSNVRGLSAWALARLKNQEAVPDIIDLLADPSSTVRANAVSSLRYLGATEAVPKMIPLLKDQDDWTRRWVAEALADFDARNSVPSLVTLLRDEKAHVRISTLMALVRLGAKEAVPSIAELLKSESAVDRCGAAWALGMLRAENAASAIVPLLKDKSPMIRGTALRALGRLRHDTGSDEISGLLRDLSPFVRGNATIALGFTGVRSSVPELRKLLADGAEVDDLAASDTLDDREDSSARERLQVLEGDDAFYSPTVRALSAESLCRLGSRDGVPVLFKAVEDSWDNGKMTPMNALRKPQLWRRLRGRTLSRRVRGRIRDLLEPIAREASFPVEAVPEALESVRKNGSTAGPEWTWAAGTPVLEALEAMAWERGCTLVLEADTIRIQNRYKAITFWKEWWKRESK